ncbi:MAG: hypothetical protein R3229_15125 [Alphaproteobacteria bacterium]|nr:hypothetical protein [Alphaproteobacteria bacterium]
MSTEIPRLEFEELSAELQDVFRARVERLGYLGEFFKVMSHAPDTMAGFYRITESLKEVLPDNFTEIVSLALSSRLGNRYEQYQNERLSRRLGFSDDWIAEAITPNDGADSVFDAEEKAVQRFAIAVMERSGQGVAAERDALVRAIGPERTVGVMWLIGRTVTHALISNTLELEAPVASIFEAETEKT